MKHMIVTGSGGLIGGEVAEYFLKLGWMVHGIDNNQRMRFFGDQGDTSWRVKQLSDRYSNYKHYEANIEFENEIKEVFEFVYEYGIDAVVHCAAQPSHDKAAEIPMGDFRTNVLGTFHMLMAAKLNCSKAPFVFMSTNKVYGDTPNNRDFTEHGTRYSPSNLLFDKDGPFAFNETMSIDQSKHSLFGAGKAAADLYVQEFGRYFGMPTVCLRGGCLTGPNHSGVELHGFLNYLIKCNLERKKYTVFGYKGKQVRDNIHSYDVARFIDMFIESPRSGEVYNIGGGIDNSISILESFEKIGHISGIPMMYEITDNVRSGDHQWYVSDLRKIKSHYPKWSVTKSLDDIFYETRNSWKEKNNPF